MNEVLIKKEQSSKKGKVVLISLFIVFSFLANKLFGPYYPILENPLILAGLYALVAVFGFMWVLRFQLNFRIVYLVLPHLGLIVFNQMLFMQMFFERTFGRVYEALLMFIVLFFVFVITYVAFLTSNIFAVASFKKIPLEAVAKTSIYFISVLFVFFATYGFLSLEMQIFPLLIILMLIYFLSATFLLMYFYIETTTILANSAMVFWNVLLIFVASALFSVRIEFVALLVATVFYYSVGFFIERKPEVASSRLLEYFLTLFLVILLTFYFSI
jgi:hypothetical protein